jgi:hypothetical protein
MRDSLSSMPGAAGRGGVVPFKMERLAATRRSSEGYGLGWQLADPEAPVSARVLVVASRAGQHTVPRLKLVLREH